MTTVSRSRDGKWLAGVCAGLARARGISPAPIRAAFVVGGLIGGLGILVYLACWLIIPQQGEQPGDLSSGWLVAVAKACAACLGLATLAVLAAVATLFGFGWVAVVLAAAVLVAVLAWWPRLSPAWALLPIAAIAVPSAAVAASGVELVAQPGNEIIAPTSLSANGVVTFRAGTGTMLVDLRRTLLPPAGVVAVHIQGGVRRTIVALPQDRCVHVALRYRVQPLLSDLASQMVGRSAYPGVIGFGSWLPGRSGVRDLAIGGYGPELEIDFSSTGGSLFVRDYPDTVDPNVMPDWPGYPVHPEPRPNVRGISKHLARYEIDAWRARHAKQVSSQRFVSSSMPGPCVASGAHG